MKRKDAEEAQQLDAAEVSEQGSKVDPAEIKRRMLRGDETHGDPNERDIAGALDFEDTPHGREETKIDKGEAANQNG